MEDEYIKAIESGFELYDEIETAILSFSRAGYIYADVEYSDGVLSIDAESSEKNIKARITIDRMEIIQIVLDEKIEPNKAICKLLKEKICKKAHDY